MRRLMLLPLVARSAHLQGPERAFFTAECCIRPIPPAMPDAHPLAHPPAGSPPPATEPAAVDALPPPRRAIRSFVLRAGRIGSGQARALADLGPRFVLPFDAGPADWPAHFGRDAPRVLEIGFGMGQATAQIAAARPGWDFIGVEVHAPGVGALLREIGEQGLSNLRIVQYDAVHVLQQMIAPASLAGVHLFFPDPWHKKRHHKRRLVQPAFVDLLASRLAPGGWLHCATDWEDYAQQMLAVLGACPALVNTAGGFVCKPDLRPLTKFEARGLKLGHGVWDLLFRAAVSAQALSRPSAPSPLPP